MERLFSIEKHNLKRCLCGFALVIIVVLVVEIHETSLTRPQGRSEGLRQVEKHGAGCGGIGGADKLRARGCQHCKSGRRGGLLSL